MVIIYIHGASATKESFTHIKEHLGGNDILISYNSANGFDQNLSLMIEQLQHTENMFFVSHSLGGIYALHLANHFYSQTLGGVSLSTPYGGSREADFARYFLPFNRLMKDIGVLSDPIAKVKQLKLPNNWTNVVTTVGASPWIHESNDGVVTIRSMRFRSDMELVELPLNHYEVVLSNQTVDIIKERIQRTND
jgi:predicted alpha/beta hydrolase family esterase